MNYEKEKCSFNYDKMFVFSTKCSQHSSYIQSVRAIASHSRRRWCTFTASFHVTLVIVPAWRYCCKLQYVFSIWMTACFKLCHCEYVKEMPTGVGCRVLSILRTYHRWKSTKGTSSVTTTCQLPQCRLNLIGFSVIARWMATLMS